MDSENVISLTGDLNLLNNDMIQWQSMTFDQRKRSDDACIRKYGRTNTELYELLKTNIELSSKSSNNAVTESYSEDELSDRLYKLNRSFMSEKSGLIIINPWTLDDIPDYTFESLEKKYLCFLSLSDDMKMYSDNESMNLWGMDVNNMYNIMKNKFLTLKDQRLEDQDPEFHLPIRDNQLSSYVSDVRTESLYIDALHKKMRVLDCISYKGSLYESAVLERLANELEDSSNSLVDYDEDIPMIVPWFTPDEMENIHDTEVDPYEYIFGRDTIELNSTIRNAMYELSIHKEDPKYLNKVLELGWNPGIPYTENAISYARKRQSNWLKSHKIIEFVDISDFVVNETVIKNPIVKLEPIFITLISHKGINSKVIQKWTNSSYSHAGISLDEDLNKIYSFNGENEKGKGGFSIENLRFYQRAKDPNLKVLTFFVEPGVKKNIKDKIDFYIKNRDKSHYSYTNIFRILLNKTKDSAYSLSLVCSQFVDNILKMCNIDVTGKPSNLVVPGDFNKPTPGHRLFILFDGKVKDYNPSSTKNKITKLLSSKLNPNGLITKPLSEAVKEIFSPKDFRDFEKFFVKTESEEANKILSEIMELLVPVAVLTEAKPLPVRFGKSGNLFIDLPRDLELEYQEAHRLLESYNESNIEGIKHQLARLFYINSIIEKKIKKMKKADKDYKDLIDLRARVINDFKKYIALVQKAESNFDFEQYMKNSEYYNKTIMVDKHTMKYTGRVIKDVMNLMKV